MATLSSLSTSAGGALRLLDRRIYTSSGTWTKPADNAGNILAGVGKIVIAKIVGGGGSGCYGGGGGGGYSEESWDISQLTGTVTCTVGAGGVGTQVAGGDSSFGSYAFAGGGQAGPSAPESGGAWEFTVVSSAYVTDALNLANSAGANRPALGGVGSKFPGGNGAFGVRTLNNSLAYFFKYVHPTRTGGPGGGGDSSLSIPGGPSFNALSNTASTTFGPGGGGTASAGKLYGGGGSGSSITYAPAQWYSGAQGVVVVETWG